MNYENEITVKVNTTYDKLHDILLKNNFIIKEEYTVKDTYMINKEINITELNDLEVLKQCILVRDVVDIEKSLVYKNKEYDSDGNIIKQSKIKCPILDIDKGIKFMEEINYIKLFNIIDKCIVYVNNDNELVVELVNDKYVFIELESNPEYINKKYTCYLDMINELNSYNLPIDKTNYFVKKAVLVLNDTVRSNK
ncbi:MAG: hypothetical protein MR550_02695 [Bacilli bacterium]|nr:hypothetical protein [Bacilli bacterium]